MYEFTLCDSIMCLCVAGSKLFMLSKSVSCVLVRGVKSAQTVQSCTECVLVWWMWSQLIFWLSPEVKGWHNRLKLHKTVSMRSQKQTMQCQPYSSSVRGQEVVSSLAPHQQLTIYMFTEEAAACLSRVSTHEHEHWEDCLCAQSLLKKRVFGHIIICPSYIISK